MGSLLVVMLNGSMLPCFQVDVEWFHEAVLRAGVACMPNFRMLGTITTRPKNNGNTVHHTVTLQTNIQQIEIEIDIRYLGVSSNGGIPKTPRNGHF